MIRAGWITIIAFAFAHLATPLIAEDCEKWRCEPLIEAEYTQPTTRYAHGVLGDDIEYGSLKLTFAGSRNVWEVHLPQSRVFEDITPRLVDVDKDGQDEVVVVESDQYLGARLAIYNANGLIAATPFIGRSNRWLAPIGAADLDGDGYLEIAYIDRPHLAKTLRIWRFSDGKLKEVTSEKGFTNHRIGWDHIPGGIRDCGQGPEMIVATADWSEIASVRLSHNGTLSLNLIENYDGPESLNSALDCP